MGYTWSLFILMQQYCLVALFCPFIDKNMMVGEGEATSAILPFACPKAKLQSQASL